MSLLWWPCSVASYAQGPFKGFHPHLWSHMFKALNILLIRNTSFPPNTSGKSDFQGRAINFPTLWTGSRGQSLADRTEGKLLVFRLISVPAHPKTHHSREYSSLHVWKYVQIIKSVNQTESIPRKP